MIKNTILDQWIAYNFATQDIFVKNNENYGKRTKKRLMSVSGFSRYLTEFKLDNIPHWILDNAKEFGSQVMTSMGLILDSKDHIKTFGDVDDYCYTQEVADCCKEVLRTLSEKNYRLKAVDKWVTNGYWEGVIDFVVRDKISKHRQTMVRLIEFKTRNSDELRWTDVFQLSIYKALVEPFKLASRKTSKTTPIEVWIYNKKTKKITIYEIGVEFQQNIKWLNQMLDFYDLKEYKLDPHPTPLSLEEMETHYGIKKYNSTFNTRNK